jgi:membrane protein YdbS with pleckstrin-like domain
MQIGIEFKPSKKMMILLLTYLVLIITPLYAAGLIGMLAFYLSLMYLAAMIFALVYLLPLTAIVMFTIFWIPKYYDSIKYLFSENEIRVERGVWWKTRQALPYSRIMNVETIQGPLSRHFGIGNVDIYTAGNTGQTGNSGPGLRRSDATILHVAEFLEIRDQILRFVRGRPLFGSQEVESDATGPLILKELKDIRKLLEEFSEK